MGSLQFQSTFQNNRLSLILQAKLPTKFQGRSSVSCKGIKFYKSAHQLQSPCQIGIHGQFRNGTKAEKKLNVHEATPAPTDNAMELQPMLSSIFIKGLPPVQQSKFLDEAKKQVMKFGERWQIKSLEPYFDVSLCCANYFYSKAVSFDGFVAATMTLIITFLLDDMLIFDRHQDDFPYEEYGIDRNIWENPQKVHDFINHLHLVFKQETLPHPDVQLEGIVAEWGHDLRRLSTPDWFDAFAQDLIDWEMSTFDTALIQVNSEGNIPLYLRDLELYTQLRFVNLGARFAIMGIEIANNAFLPPNVRKHPTMEQLIVACGMYAGFINDIFSYSKEVAEPDNYWNLVKVFMETENLLLHQAMCKVIDLVNLHGGNAIKAATMSSLIWESDSFDSVVNQYVEGVMLLMTGNIFFHLQVTRYRHPNHIFPELRSTTFDHKVLQEAYIPTCMLGVKF